MTFIVDPRWRGHHCGFSHRSHEWKMRCSLTARSCEQDIVTRYAHQTGHFVERRFGWDCHGLPIEFEIEQDLGIKVSCFPQTPESWCLGF